MGFFVANAQIKKQFSVENDAGIDQVDFSFKVNSGKCFIKPSQKTDLISIYSNHDVDYYDHTFSRELVDRTEKITIELKDNASGGFSQSISSRVLGKSEDRIEKIWQVYLSNKKPFNLNLNYGTGDSKVDLSGLSVKNLRINTASANIHVNYFSGLSNQVVMDTFFVKVDWGTAVIEKVNLLKSRNLIAEVGFGNLSLDFSDKCDMRSNIQASVGAGKLHILLPPREVPVIIRMKNSLLCTIKLDHDFKKIGENVYTNAAYKEDAADLLSFDLDVSMGNITFKSSSH